MTLQEYLATSPLRPADVARIGGVNRSYIHRVLNRGVPLSRRVAVKLWNQTGVKVDPITDARDEELRFLLNEAA